MHDNVNNVIPFLIIPESLLLKNGCWVISCNMLTTVSLFRENPHTRNLVNCISSCLEEMESNDIQYLEKSEKKVWNLVFEMTSLMTVKCNSEIWSSDDDGLQQDFKRMYLYKQWSKFHSYQISPNYLTYAYISCANT